MGAPTLNLTMQQSMSKSDLRFMNNRMEAQWRMNRMRKVHALRHSFEYMCLTERLGSAVQVRARLERSH